MPKVRSSFAQGASRSRYALIRRPRRGRSSTLPTMPRLAASLPRPPLTSTCRRRRRRLFRSAGRMALPSGCRLLRLEYLAPADPVVTGWHGPRRFTSATMPGQCAPAARTGLSVREATGPCQRSGLSPRTALLSLMAVRLAMIHPTVSRGTFESPVRRKISCAGQPKRGRSKQQRPCVCQPCVLYRGSGRRTNGD